MRIGNVAQTSPSHSFVQGFQAVPQYHQNSLAPFSLPSIVPSSSPMYSYPPPSSYSPYQHASIAASPSPAFSQAVMNNPNYSLYNYAQHFPQKSTFFPTSPAYAPTPSAHPLQQHHHQQQQQPVRSFYKLKASSPYSFEQFGGVDSSNSYPFQQLNAGETLPQSNSLVNLNFGFAGEVYRPNRFARNLSQNATSHYWIRSERRQVTLHFTPYTSFLCLPSPSPHTTDIFPFIRAIPSV